MKKILIKNAQIINEGANFKGSILINNNIIEEIFDSENITIENAEIIDANGKILIPGVIDDHVHFREPGLTSKGDIESESKAAIAGGVTSTMDMPNVNPQTTTNQLLEERVKIAQKKSYTNYSFYLGATNDNINEIINTDKTKVCGIKVFMGSSTGNMLVDDENMLSQLFSKSPILIATHCEDTNIINANTKAYREKYGNNIPIEYHGKIRSEEACYKSTKLAIELAKKHNTKLHVLHLTTKKELELFDNLTPLEKKRITGEVCVHHLWFNDSAYKTKGSLVRWNPAIKTKEDQEGLLQGLINNKLDIIGTDHAPHELKSKKGEYGQSAGGGPSIQHSLPIMLEFYNQGKLKLETLVEKMCHAPATVYNIKKRGFIRKGYFADLVLIDKIEWTVNKDNILYKCAWAPYEGDTFHYKVEKTFVNGNLIYDNGKINNTIKGMPLEFER